LLAKLETLPTEDQLLSPLGHLFMNSELLQKARTIHRHLIRFRNYVLRGDGPANVWKKEGFEPTIPQIRAMMMLHMAGKSTLKNLASALDISHPSASQMVDRLVEMDMVNRVQDPEDRRRVMLTLSEPAKRCMEEHEKAILCKIVLLMEQMDPKVVDQWEHLANHLTDILDQHPDLGIPSSGNHKN